MAQIPPLSHEPVAREQPTSVQGVKSAMDDPKEARWLTERLAGRAANTAATLAKLVSLDGARRLVDVGGGTGIFAFAFLQKYPDLPLKSSSSRWLPARPANYAGRYGVGDRVTCVVRDMFKDDLPKNADAILLSNVLHDWDVDKSRDMVKKSQMRLSPAASSSFTTSCSMTNSMAPRTSRSIQWFCFTSRRAVLIAGANTRNGSRMPVWSQRSRSRRWSTAGLSSP